jgi:hypothetical protein
LGARHVGGRGDHSGGGAGANGPVLAGDVQVSDAHDRDRLRFGLTGEAGLNDGAAFPFVMLGMGLLSLHDLGRAMALVGDRLRVGSGRRTRDRRRSLGLALGRWVLHRLRTGTNETGPDAFLGLGLVAVAYGIAVTVNAYGFLAVFAAAVALQWTVTESGERDATPKGRRRRCPAKRARTRHRSVAANSTPGLESLFEFGGRDHARRPVSPWCRFRGRPRSLRLSSSS